METCCRLIRSYRFSLCTLRVCAMRNCAMRNCAMRNCAMRNCAMRNKGFTLIETLLVIGIIALLAIAAFVIYPTARAARQTQNAFDSYNATLGAHKSYFASRNYDGITRALAISAGIATDQMMQTAWGQIVPGPAQPSAAGGAVCVTTCKVLSLTIKAVPTMQCERFVNQVEPYASRIVVGLIDVKNATTAMTIAATATACATAATEDVLIYPSN